MNKHDETGTHRAHRKNELKNSIYIYGMFMYRQREKCVYGYTNSNNGMIDLECTYKSNVFN